MGKLIHLRENNTVKEAVDEVLAELEETEEIMIVTKSKPDKDGKNRVVANWSKMDNFLGIFGMLEYAKLELYNFITKRDKK